MRVGCGVQGVRGGGEGSDRGVGLQFEVALVNVNAAHDFVLAEEQIKMLIDTLVLDGEGLLDFKGFFDDFDIIDTALGLADDDSGDDEM